MRKDVGVAFRVRAVCDEMLSPVGTARTWAVCIGGLGGGCDGEEVALDGGVEGECAAGLGLAVGAVAAVRYHGG